MKYSMAMDEMSSKVPIDLNFPKEMEYISEYIKSLKKSVTDNYLMDKYLASKYLVSKEIAIPPNPSGNAIIFKTLLPGDQVDLTDLESAEADAVSILANVTHPSEVTLKHVNERTRLYAVLHNMRRMSHFMYGKPTLTEIGASPDKRGDKLILQAQYSTSLQKWLLEPRFVKAMIHIGLLPHEALMLMAANDKGFNWSELNHMVAQLPSTYNYTPTAQRYRDSIKWTQKAYHYFHNDTWNDSFHYAARPYRIFCAAQYQARLHGIELNEREWFL